MIPTSENIRACAFALERGELVVVPTETVYGLAANAFDEAAVLRIYEAKGRPPLQPLSVLVPNAQLAAALVHWSRSAEVFAAEFWPGPLTMVLPDRGVVAPEILAGGTKLGVRCPRQQVLTALFGLCDFPLATPSANVTSEPAPVTVEEISKKIIEKSFGVLDGGRCEVGVASTVLDLSNPQRIRILRPGAISQELLMEASRDVIDRSAWDGP